MTKTLDFTRMDMNNELFEIFSKLDKKRPEGCNYFFHNKGKPLRHALILKKVNEAFKTAGLNYSGTHVLRHSMATHIRRKFGLDAAQQIRRHHSLRQTEHYAKLDPNKKISELLKSTEKDMRLSLRKKS